MIKLELNDEKEEKDDWLKKRAEAREAGKNVSAKDKNLADESEERKSRLSGLASSLSPKNNRIVDYRTSETAFDPEKDF